VIELGWRNVSYWHDVSIRGDACVEDFEVAEAAVKRWPKIAITLRAGARVTHDSREPE
jgi:hypothetical protein